MEILENREQPEQHASNANVIENNEEEKVVTFDAEKGSQFGKFKDAKSLLDAYNNLQAEFTRKCQKLSQAVKENEQLNNLPKAESSDAQQPENLKETADEQKSAESSDLQSATEDDKTYAFKSSNWNLKVVDFLKNNNLANEYKQEISNEILKDKNLQQSENCLDLAWARVMEKEFKPVKQILNDEEFVNSQILSNEKIKQKIIEDYITSLSKTNPPKTISSVGGTTSFSANKQALNLSDAKDIVAEMFNVKGE